ncbi:MAG: hypothetical protein Kow0080_15760 [Candidatus Promineifilaceae bacterium]
MKDKIIHWLNKLKKKTAETQNRQTHMQNTHGNEQKPQTNLNEQALKRLLHQIEQTKSGMYTCEETFALLDEYVELAASQQNAAAIMPLVERHLAICQGCKEKYDILLDILQASDI